MKRLFPKNNSFFGYYSPILISESYYIETIGRCDRSIFISSWVQGPTIRLLPYKSITEKPATDAGGLICNMPLVGLGKTLKDASPSDKSIEVSTPIEIFRENLNNVGLLHPNK